MAGRFTFIHVTVRTMMGEEWMFELPTSTAIYELKVFVYGVKGMHPDQQVSGDGGYEPLAPGAPLLGRGDGG